MRLYKNELGSITVISKAEDQKLFEKVNEMATEIKAGRFLTANPLFVTLSDFGQCGRLEDTECMFPVLAADEKRNIINIVIPKVKNANPVDCEKKYREFMLSIQGKDISYKKVNEDDFLKVYNSYLDENGDFNQQIGLEKDMGEIRDPEKIQEPLEIPFENFMKSEKSNDASSQGEIYILDSVRDIFQVKDYVSGIYLFNGKYYAQAKRGLILDDFFEKTYIDATKGMKILI